MERAMSMMSLSIDAVRSHRLPHWNELCTTFVESRQRARSRRALLSLDDRELRDMGLTRSDARYEAHKHFWQD
jgi:uncharacterized protein YjiS (DUF1127 family)